MFDVNREVRGCVLLELYRLNDCRPKKHFKIWFNTLLLKSSVVGGMFTYCHFLLAVIYDTDSQNW